MTIPDEAVQAALDTWLDHEFDGTLNGPRMRNALTAALPFLTGVNVAQGTGVGVLRVDDYGQFEEFECATDLKLPAGSCDLVIDLNEPSTRAQALEEACAIVDKYDALVKNSKYRQAKIHLEVNGLSFLRALSSQPGADHIAAAGKMVEGNGWLPIETCPPEHVLFFGVDRHGDKVAVEGFKAVNGTLCVGNKDLKPFTFTHWRPLPAAPEVAG